MKEINERHLDVLAMWILRWMGKVTRMQKVRSDLSNEGETKDNRWKVEEQ